MVTTSVHVPYAVSLIDRCTATADTRLTVRNCLTTCASILGELDRYLLLCLVDRVPPVCNNISQELPGIVGISDKQNASVDACTTKCQ